MGDGKKVYDSEGVDQALTNLQTKGCTTQMLEEPTKSQGKILKTFGYEIEKGVLQNLDL